MRLAQLTSSIETFISQATMNSIVMKKVKEQYRTNVELRKRRYGFERRFLSFFIEGKRLARTFAFYLLIASTIIAIALQNFSSHYYIDFTSLERIFYYIKDINSYFLGAQVALVGVLFPLAITLVTVIVTRQAKSDNVSDIRIYYHESLALGVGASGLTLSVILAVEQTFLPYIVQTGSIDLLGSAYYRYGISILNCTWLILNITATWYFMRTSFLFVDGGFRRQMRERYTANFAIKQYLTNGLQTAFWKNLASHFGGINSHLRDYGIGRDHEIKEIDIHHSDPVTLVNVSLHTLRFAIWSWSRRNRDTDPGLVFLNIAPGIEVFGKTSLIARRGGTPFNILERLLIKWSFRFRKTGHDTLPQPIDILHILIDELVKAIDNRSEPDINDSLEGLVGYHVFLLKALRNLENADENYAEMAADWYRVPYQSWNHVYSKIFSTLEQVYSEHPQYVHTFSGIAGDIFYRIKDDVSVRISASLLDIEMSHFRSLANWKRRNSEQSGSQHSSIEQRILQTTQDKLMFAFVHGWERFGSHVGRCFDAASNEDELLWSSFHAALPLVQRHLLTSLKLTLMSILNRDFHGIHFMVDMVSMWPATLKFNHYASDIGRHNLYIPETLPRNSRSATNRFALLGRENGVLVRSLISNIHFDAVYLSASIGAGWQYEVNDEPIRYGLIELLTGRRMHPNFAPQNIDGLEFNKLLFSFCRMHLSMSSYRSWLDKSAEELDFLIEPGRHYSRTYSPRYKRIDSLHAEMAAFMLISYSPSAGISASRLTSAHGCDGLNASNLLNLTSALDSIIADLQLAHPRSIAIAEAIMPEATFEWERTRLISVLSELSNGLTEHRIQDLMNNFLETTELEGIKENIAKMVYERPILESLLKGVSIEVGNGEPEHIQLNYSIQELFRYQGIDGAIKSIANGIQDALTATSIKRLVQVAIPRGEIRQASSVSIAKFVAQAHPSLDENEAVVVLANEADYTIIQEIIDMLQQSTARPEHYLMRFCSLVGPGELIVATTNSIEHIRIHNHSLKKCINIMIHNSEVCVSLDVAISIRKHRIPVRFYFRYP